jgi:hypothetical protein
MFGADRDDDMGQSRRYVVFVLVCFMFPLFQSPLAEAVPNQNSRDLMIYQQNGMVFDEMLYLNGSSSFPLSDLDWHLVLHHSNGSIMPLDSGKLTSVTAVSESQWDWELELNVSSYNCTCELVLTDSIHERPIRDSRVVYLGSQNHQPFILPFISAHFGLHGQHPLFLLSDGDLELKIPMITPDQSATESFVEIGVCPALNGLCLTEMADYTNFNLSSNTQDLELIFERDNLDLVDGYWLFNITVVDALLRPSNTEHFYLLVDQTPPQVTLACDLDFTAVTEGSTESLSAMNTVEEFSSISFSASVDDGYLGGENILTWTLLLPDGSRRALTSDEKVSNTLIYLNPEIPGTWVVELLVRDTAGRLAHSSVEFEVENLAPVIQIELDSFILTEGSTVTLNDGDVWEINSSKSFDTINDNSDLLHTWYVDGKTLVSGKSTIQSSDFSETGTYDVRLVVQDNDGASTEVSFQIHISDDITSNALSSQTLLFSGSVIFLAILLLGVFINSSRKHAHQTKVPKWVSKESSKDSDDS